VLSIAEVVEVYDVVGKLQKFEIKKMNNTIIINILRLASGMYFITITDDENQVKITKKVVKEYR